ncbi:protein kinase, putative [Trypanosoma brucei gambiense DAL972]|uniref:Protein kinase, putative n=1 Tax=Trypanosoma brucei gambiense (strain MHOM/CI/86/DAL972) TaxID=679716 RepID=D0A811_TRYB9|nr:protein kinase, putative [Trypanosoma brucei gambiense DAL972]CBH17812.1 protein kinase, putative [Trypanosoma brucei gambiense DAL972]|eukprot:XP_011780076.1 protein kinase, putative [Trypanosoma brucei gambiense DAL972]
MNNYHIYDEIGKGRHSRVYKGRQRKSIEYYAISSIEKSQRQHVLTNVKFLRSSNHPRIIKFHNWYETNNHLWVITELCTGGDMRQVLHPESRLSEAAVRLYGGDIAEGLMYIHSRGVVYRDLKPSNVLMDSTMAMRFYDFGLSCNFPVNRGGGTIGTAMYMAPELFTKEGVPSIASDLWSFGCVLLEMRTGKPPFDADNLEELITQILTEPYHPHEELSDELNELLGKLLVKNPLERATWEDVVLSPFWQGRLHMPAAPHPPQPAFESLKQKRLASDGGKGDFVMTLEEAKKAVEWTVEVAKRNFILTQPDSDGSALICLGVYDRIDTRDLTGEGGGVHDPTSGSLIGDGNSCASPSSCVARVGCDSNAGRQGDGAAQREGDHNREMVSDIGTAVGGNAAKNSNVKQLAGGGKFSTALIDSLLSHVSDAHVRPLVMNNHIERFVEQKYDAKALGFEPLTKSQLKAYDEEQKARFVTKVYQRLSSSSLSCEDKLNVLCYFESICSESSTANFVVSSSIMTLCLNMAGHRKASSSFRATAASIMGILVRHATFIHPDLAKVNILASIVKMYAEEESSRVRRKLVACYGEFLIYIAVQQERERAVWGVDVPATFNLYRSLLNDPDDVQKHYAIKTIENLASVGNRQIALDAFVNAETISLLLSIYALPPTPTCGEYMRAAAACTALKLAMLREELIPAVLESPYLKLEAYGGVLAAPSPKLAQALLTFVNMTLVKGMVGLRHANITKLGKPDATSPFASSRLTGDKAKGVLTALSGVAEAVVRGLRNGSEHATTAMKGKTLVLFILLGCMDEQLLVRFFTSSRCVAYVDGIAKDKDSYVQRCTQGFAVYLSYFFGSQLEGLTHGAPSFMMNNVPSALCNLLGTRHLSSMLQLNDKVFSSIGKCLVMVSSSSRYAAAGTNLHELVELLAQNRELVLRHRLVISSDIFPPYLSMLAESESERRFLSLRILRALIVPFGSESSRQNEEAQKEGAMLDRVMQVVAGMLGDLLKEVEPIPVHGIGLLATCGERRPKTLANLATVELIGELVRYMMRSRQSGVSSPLQLVMLALQTERGGVLMDYLAEQNFPAEVLLNILVMAVEKDVDNLLEPCCELFEHFLKQAVANPNAAALRQSVMSVAPRALETLWLPLCTSPVGTTAKSAAACVLYFTQLSPEVGQELLSDGNVQYIREVLDKCRSPGAVVCVIRTLRLILERGTKHDAQKLMPWLLGSLEAAEQDQKCGGIVALEIRGIKELLRP